MTNRVADCHHWQRKLDRRPVVHQGRLTTTALMNIRYMRLYPSYRRRPGKPRRSQTYCSELPVSAVRSSLEQQLQFFNTDDKIKKTYWNSLASNKPCLTGEQPPPERYGFALRAFAVWSTWLVDISHRWGCQVKVIKWPS